MARTLADDIQAYRGERPSLGPGQEKVLTDLFASNRVGDLWPKFFKDKTFSNSQVILFRILEIHWTASQNAGVKNIRATARADYSALMSAAELLTDYFSAIEVPEVDSEQTPQRSREDNDQIRVLKKA